MDRRNSAAHGASVAIKTQSVNADGPLYKSCSSWPKGRKFGWIDVPENFYQNACPTCPVPKLSQL